MISSINKKPPGTGYSMKGGNWIHHTAVIDWDFVTIGTGNIIDAYAVIGTEGEIKGIKQFNGRVVIGNDNHIGEHITIQRPDDIKDATVIGNGCYIMTKTHIGHHAQIKDGAILASGCIIGGHSIVGENAYLGLGSIVHPKKSIGQIACLGMNSTVTKNVPDFETWHNGSAAKFHCVNEIGMQRNGFSPDEIEQLKDEK